MKKKLTFVVHIVMSDEGLEGNIRKSLEDFKWRTQGAFDATITIQEEKE